MNTFYKSLFLLFAILPFSNTHAQTTTAHDFNNGVFLAWNNLFLELDRYAAGYRPGPGPRALGYMGLSAYESVVHGIPENQSLRTQFPDLMLPQAQTNTEYYYPACVNESYYYLMQQFFSYFQTAQPARFARIAAVHDSLNTIYTAQTTATILTRSKNFGTSVAAAVWIWEQTDVVGHNAHLNPQPTNYVPPAGSGLWQPTAPDFSRAMFPNWGNIRYFALPNAERTSPPPLPYSELPTSPLYLEAKEVYDICKKIKNDDPTAHEEHWRAEFWSDDMVNVTFSPPSRLIAITNQLTKRQNQNLAQASEIYAKMGLTLNDTGGAVWKSKYTYNIERPVDYIRRVLSAEFPDAATFQSNLNNTLTGVQGITPAFPAYPSGHSGFGGAGSAILSHIFEKNGNLAFIDSSHYGRSDFLGMPRAYGNITESGEENAFSRIPLGVHFRMDCVEGLRMGRLAAQRIIELPWKKPVVQFDCNAVTMTPGTGNITIANLTAPITMIQVYNSNWQPVYNCSGNCQAGTQVIPNLAAGQYFVKVDFLTAAWQPICNKEQYVTITSGGGNGGGGGNTPNCANISMTGDNGSITINNLSAPISIIQVYNAAWQRIFNCSGNCDAATQVIPNLPAGQYFVKVDFLTATWQPICNKEQYVTVTSGGGNGGGGTGTPDCAAITMTGGNGEISVNNLTAPLSVIQVFNASWQRIFNCSGDCQTNTQLISNLPAGQYFVKVDFLTATWQPICNKEQYVTVTSGGGNGGGGGTGTPDCAAITMTTNSNGITIGNLTAPISMIQVFNSAWVAAFSCSGNCNQQTQIISGLPAGQYYVKVDFLTANWQPICKKEQFVTIGGTNLQATTPPLVFDAYKRGTLSLLKWESHTSNYNKFFIVERSADGRVFSPISKIDAFDDETNFEFYDENPLEGSNYYRIRLVFENGSELLSDIQKIDFPKQITESAGLTVFPNPAHDKVFVTFDPELSANTILHIQLFNQLGNEVQNFDLPADSYSAELDLSGLSSGLYLLRLSGEGIRPVARKILLENAY